MRVSLLVLSLFAIPLAAQQTVNFSLTVDNAFVLSIAKTYPNPAVQVEIYKITAANAAIQALIVSGVQ